MAAGSFWVDLRFIPANYSVHGLNRYDVSGYIGYDSVDPVFADKDLAAVARLHGALESNVVEPGRSERND
jgi:hypothetical protein